MAVQEDAARVSRDCKRQPKSSGSTLDAQERRQWRRSQTHNECIVIRPEDCAPRRGGLLGDQSLVEVERFGPVPDQHGLARLPCCAPHGSRRRSNSTRRCMWQRTPKNPRGRRGGTLRRHSVRRAGRGNREWAARSPQLPSQAPSSWNAQGISATGKMSIGWDFAT